jgi:uncharacterized membrane protein
MATFKFRPPMSSAALINLDRVRSRLAAVWLTGGGLVFFVVVIQSLMGRYGEKTQDAWGWLLPTIMPTMGMIVTVLGYTALDPLLSSTTVVRNGFFQTAFWLSLMYLVLVLLTVLMQPLVAGDPVKAVELMRLSNLWLGPFQGLVASALGILFISKEKTNQSSSNQ